MEQRTRRSAVRSAAIGVLAVAAIAGAIAAVKAQQFATIGAAFAAQAEPVERVNAVTVRREHWQPSAASVGSVVAVHGTTVAAEAEGVVRAIRFEPGSVVEAGTVLVLLDDEVEQSELRAAEATAELARLTFERAKRLFGDRAVSQADLETAEAAFKQANARVDAIRAAIDKKVVRAPFAGKLGIRRISVGQFLAKGAPVVSLQSLDPVYVEFSLPQQRIGALVEGLRVGAASDAYPEQRFVGAITAVEPQVDTATRNVRVQATFPNGEGRLRPGMFVSVDVALGAAAPVNVVPATAVAHAPDGDAIFVIEPGETADGAAALVLRRKPVRLGARRGDFVAVLDGVETGEQVVATGVFKLRAGMPVTVDNELTPAFAAMPDPNNG